MTSLQEQIKDANIQSVQKISNAHYEWLLQYDQHFTHAVTLTFHPKKIRKLVDCISTSKMLSRADLLELQKKSFGCFRFKLNKLLFGNAVTRYGAGLLIVPAIEGLYDGGRVHYHCAIGVPSDRMDVFESKVRVAWAYAPLAGSHIDIQPYRNKGWLGYLSKQAKYLNRECIDWDNVAIPRHFASTAE